MTVTIYHNPACSTSRKTLALIREKGIEPDVIEYLKTPPSSTELKRLIKKMGLKARDVIRRKEALYGELGLDDPALSDDELIAAMAAHPRLIERPIVVSDRGVRLGRPPESVLEIL
ncbi:arsenate reductase (glutaredoxin) [Hyphomicrobium sulfonivorans]|uniref:arsenate reductase (glutaredoxin) n=1 Tax=Hyphomicrobium sulfonivorans TaxID=121290 RepID=UPI00156F94AB|nr:arsenate reductase (glutaredoxin) [Hyphomicrobium sulfonivorans]MBI1650924.1 arsenate reductase (glutaredoxin) [Hyphomicrobium sulfonivorans]NSL72693.1 arsenate reductase (glutaredoxin) [Hyphomicrobium sulfonivorans]